MTISKHDILANLDFGRRIAEEEADKLGEYFVKTAQWKKLVSGEVDVVFGAKGTGKSAMYSTLQSADGDFFDRGIILVSAENPRGAPAFRSLASSPPTSETEFINIWKLYSLSLIGSILSDYGLDDKFAKSVRAALVAEGLLPSKDAPLSARLKIILDWFRRIKLEGNVTFDPSGMAPSGVGGSIKMEEPALADRESGARSVDALLAEASKSLAANRLQVWLLFDRLDVAFAESADLEANGLRSLFKCYLDLLNNDNIRFKIFLRSDIWQSITMDGFREGSHITRSMNITWNRNSLLNLVINRVLSNSEIADFVGVQKHEVLDSTNAQRKVFDSLVPDQIDVGKNPKTFEWVLGRVQDGTDSSTPREVIHLLTEAKDVQLQMFERGEDQIGDEGELAGKELISRRAFREALRPVSRARLEQTIYAEYPDARIWIAAMEQEKTEQSTDTLAKIWDVSFLEATQIADRLVEVGFFQKRGTKDAPRYWVPFLYRPGLEMVQGTAT